MDCMQISQQTTAILSPISGNDVRKNIDGHKTEKKSY